MKKHILGNTPAKKYYVLFETDEKGIRQYKDAPEEERVGTSLSKMRVEGKWVPAIQMEVTKKVYDEFKRKQWMDEYYYERENRCIIGDPDGKSRFCPRQIPNPDYTEGGESPKTIKNDCDLCPYFRMFRLFKGKVLFSTLEVTDEQGNTDVFDPVTPHHFYQADKYLSLLYGLIEFIKEKHLRNDKYVELVELLGHEYTLSEAAEILDIPYRTLYGWLKTLRPIFDEYMNNTDYI